MKRNYLVFYSTSNGYGSTDVKTNRAERLNKIENIRKIEEVLSETLNTNISVINFKYVGKSWK